MTQRCVVAITNPVLLRISQAFKIIYLFTHFLFIYLTYNKLVSIKSLPQQTPLTIFHSWYLVITLVCTRIFQKLPFPNSTATISGHLIKTISYRFCHITPLKTVVLSPVAVVSVVPERHRALVPQRSGGEVGIDD